MKTCILIPIFIISLLFAQDESANWHLGIQLGAGKAFQELEFQNTNTSNSARPIIGLNGGFSIRRRIGQLLWLESGIQINRLGVQATDFLFSPPFQEINNIHEYHYLNIPLLAKMYTKGNRFRAFAILGPQINLGISWVQIKQITYDDGRFEEIRSSLADILPFNRKTLSLVGGFGLSLSLSKKFSLEGRFFTQRDVTFIGAGEPKLRLYYLAGNIGAQIKL